MKTRPKVRERFHSLQDYFASSPKFVAYILPAGSKSPYGLSPRIHTFVANDRVLKFFKRAGLERLPHLPSAIY